jgi:HEAT repeat protein
VRRSGWSGVLAALWLAAATAGADVGKYVEQLAGSDREQRRDAAYHLSVMGAAAKPALPALLKALDDADRQVWAYAVATLGALGPDAKDAIPKLVEGLDTRTSRGFRPRDKAQTLYRSAYTLASIGEAAKQPLLDALKSDDPGLRLGAAKAFGFMGPKAPEAVPGLIESLGHSDAEVRAEAADALASIGKAALAPLISSLGWPDPKARAGSARALGAMGSAAADAGQALLTKAGDDPDLAVRAEALVAAVKVRVAPQSIIPALIAATKATEPELQRAALDALLLMRPPDPAITALQALLGDSNYAPRAARMLGRLGRAARGTVPALLALADKAPAAESTYVEAIVSIGGAAVPAVLAEVAKIPPASLTADHWTLKILGSIGGATLPEVQKALESKNASVRVAALHTLARLGSDARSAGERVAQLAQDADASVRAAALPALVAIDPKVPQVFEPLETGLADKAPAARLAAASAAGTLGAKARPLASKVATLLGDPSHDVQIGAARALGEIGGSGEWTAQLLAKLDDAKVRLAVIESLAKLQVPGAGAKLAALYPNVDRQTRLAILGAVGGTGDAALPILRSAAEDKDPELRAAGLRATAKNGPMIETFIPALITALEDPERVIRVAAADAVLELAPKASEQFEPVIEPLAKLAASESERELAIDALRTIRTRNLEVIARVLESPVVEARLWAIERLGRMGRQAQPARDKLEKLLADENDYLRRASRRALQQIGR